jgi:uncharacterized protein YndB with AHSA1/START domain
VTEEDVSASVRTSRVIRARLEELYAAFLDPTALVDWLAPAEMTGEIHEFDARIGGGYRMSLFYPPDECTFPRQHVRQGGHGQRKVLELTPPRSIVEAVSCATTDPAFFASNDPVRVQVARHPAKKRPPRYRKACRRSDPLVGRNSPGAGILFRLTAYIRRGTVLHMEQPTIGGSKSALCARCSGRSFCGERDNPAVVRGIGTVLA